MASKRTVLLNRPKGKRLQYCLTFLLDCDTTAALQRSGYRKPSARLVGEVEEDATIQQEIVNIRRFAGHFFQHFDSEAAFCDAYDIHGDDVKNYHAEISELLSSDSVEAQLRELRNGEVSLPDHYQKFADHYRLCWNATEAAAQTFPHLSRASAGQKGHQLLKNPKIRLYLQAKRRQEAEQVDVDRQWVLKKLIQRATAKLTDFVDIEKDGTIRFKQLDRVPEEKLELLRSVSRSRENGIQVKIPDGMSELALLSKYVGLTSDWNALLAGWRKYGYIVKPDDNGGFLVVPESREMEQGLEDLAEYDEEVDLPWEADTDDEQ